MHLNQNSKLFDVNGNMATLFEAAFESLKIPNQVQPQRCMITMKHCHPSSMLLPMMAISWKWASDQQS
jgi:hypothetical protein